MRHFLLTLSISLSFALITLQLQAADSADLSCLRLKFTEVLAQRYLTPQQDFFSKLESRLSLGKLTDEQKLSILSARESAKKHPYDAFPILKKTFTNEQAQTIIEEFVFRNNPNIDWFNSAKSLSRSTTFSHIPERSVSRDEWLKWTLDDVKTNHGKVLNYEMASSNVKISQQVLLTTDFPEAEQKLISGLLKDSKNPKYVRRDAALEEKISRGTVDRPHDQNTVDRLRPLVSEPAVEVGEWKIELRSGKIIRAKMTSSLLRSITGEDVTTALNSILRRQDVRYQDLKSIQFFHIHPLAGAPPFKRRSTGNALLSKVFCKRIRAPRT